MDDDAAKTLADYDPNRASCLSRCPTCGQRRPPPKPDGWGKTMDWWDCWPCRFCGVMICNMPVDCGKHASEVCYVRHMAACHPELYTRAAST